MPNPGCPTPYFAGSWQQGNVQFLSTIVDRVRLSRRGYATPPAAAHDSLMAHNRQRDKKQHHQDGGEPVDIQQVRRAFRL